MTCSYPDTYSDLDAPCLGWDERIVVARKPHTCGECGAPINPGERYGRASGIIMPGFDADPGPRTWKRCMACWVLADRLQTEFELCIPWGTLLQAWSDLEPEQADLAWEQRDDREASL